LPLSRVYPKKPSTTWKAALFKGVERTIGRGKRRRERDRAKRVRGRAYGVEWYPPV
jgi:hypothetical protein